MLGERIQILDCQYFPSNILNLFYSLKYVSGRTLLAGFDLEQLRWISLLLSSTRRSIPTDGPDFCQLQGLVLTMDISPAWFLILFGFQVSDALIFFFVCYFWLLFLVLNLFHLVFCLSLIIECSFLLDSCW